MLSCNDYVVGEMLVKLWPFLKLSVKIFKSFILCFCILYNRRVKV